MIPDWLLNSVGCLIEVQPGTSVLELGTPMGLDGLLPERVYFQRAEPDFGAEPVTKYGLVLAAPERGHAVCELPCLESQLGPVLDTEAAVMEWATKCCAQGSLLVMLLPDSVLLTNPAANAHDLLTSTGLVMLWAHVDRHILIVYRHGIKRAPRPELKTFGSGDEFLEWAMGQNPIKTGVCTEDPGALQLKRWEIRLADNSDEKAFVRAGEPDVTQLYLAKGEARVRWSGLAPMLEWAQHQALQQPPEPSWDKAVAKFRARLQLDQLADLVGNVPLNQIMNLPGTYPIALERPLAKHLARFTRSRGRLTTTYPEKTTPENRYFTLGPGATLRHVDTDETWRVAFSEPDFANHKPPRLHIEKEI